MGVKEGNSVFFLSPVLSEVPREKVPVTLHSTRLRTSVTRKSWKVAGSEPSYSGLSCSTK